MALYIGEVKNIDDYSDGERIKVRVLPSDKNLTVDELYKAGVTTKVNLSRNQNVRLFAYALENGTTGYAVGLNNFHSIMRYNTSPLYARAVYELSEFIATNVDKIKRERGQNVPHRSHKP